ncbi:DUF4199 domain-containing protein [Pedobacter sp. L105]|uniref:DUF4199 domain-containing protein n=1 Tax=Pedobacter sp. L105 TaxID=1641871 RepID=UPI00131C3376|nr:DUF4199 domain-containing protein [Pedobacter sp. L105]
MEQQLKELELRPNKLAFQVAIVFSIYTLALIYLFKVLGIDVQVENVKPLTKFISSLLSYGPFVMAVIYAQMRHREELGGYMSFGRAFSTGFRVGATSGLFIGILMVLYYKVLDRPALDHLIDVSVSAAEKMDNPEQAVKGVHMMGPYMGIFIAGAAAISYTIYGLIISLIGAFVFKKVPPLNLED